MRGHHRSRLEARQHPARLRIEENLVQIHRDVAGVRAAQLDIAVGIAGVEHPHEIRRAAAPAGCSCRAHGVDGAQLAGRLGRLARVLAIGFGHERRLGLGAFAVSARVQLREVDGNKNDQARERDHEVEWQRHHAGQVMQVQSAALQALMRTKREKLFEYLLVDHHSGDQQHQHAHRCQAHQPLAQLQPLDVQGIVKRHQETGGRIGLLRRQQGVGVRVDEAAMLGALGVAPGQFRHRVAAGGQVDAPLPGAGRHLRHGSCRQPVQRQRRMHLRDARLRQHPAVDLAAEHAQGAEPEYREQQAADDHAGPRVQQRHRLGQRIAHASLPPTITQPAAPPDRPAPATDARRCAR